MRTNQQLCCDDNHCRKHKTFLQKQFPPLKESLALQGVLQPLWGVCSLSQTVCKRSSQKASVSQKSLFGPSSIVPHPGWREKDQQWRCMKLKIHLDIRIHNKMCFAWIFAFTALKDICAKWDEMGEKMSTNFIFCIHIICITGILTGHCPGNSHSSPTTVRRFWPMCSIKKSNLLEKDSKQLIKSVSQHQLQTGISPRSPSCSLC